MGDSSIETGDVKIGNINSSLEVLCSGISIVFSKHSSKKLAPVAQVDFSERFVYQSTSIYHHFSKILRQCMGNAASEVVNSGSKLAFTSSPASHYPPDWFVPKQVYPKKWFIPV